VSLSERDQVVLGIDVGTTATKVVAFDTGGGVRGEASAGYPLLEPQPGYAEQDPEAIVEAVVASVREAARAAEAGGARVAGVAFSSAMHSLLALDRDGRPATPSIIWADTRAAPQAERLRADPIGLGLHQRTGTPVHPMSPLTKLVWFREQDERRFAAAWKWVGIKDFLFHHLTGEWVIDHSCASGSGLMELSKLDWDAEALAVAGIDAGRLPQLVPTTYVSQLAADAAAELGLAPGTPVVAGGGDGPLANLGLGAVRPGVAACSIGTSGAIRVVVEQPAVDPLGRVFCYALTPGRWVVGGAINNGGVVLQWAEKALTPDFGEHGEAALLDLVASVPAGSDGLLMLPYLLSERAPHWSALARGAYVGLTNSHGRAHLVRAALEGVCLQLALVLHSVEEAGNEIREIRATGGFARSPEWRQMLADALDMEIGFPSGHEGSSFGAALIGMEALGLIESIEVAAERMTIESVVAPEAGAVATYRALLPVFAALYDALVPTFTELRKLDPMVKGDAGERQVKH
jgi:gluconokinase